MKKWLIKNSQGEIFGPYSTERVLKKIDDGAIDGLEFVALFPGTEWQPISKDPVFYDRLIEIINSDGKKQPEKKPSLGQPPPTTNESIKSTQADSTNKPNSNTSNASQSFVNASLKNQAPTPQNAKSKEQPKKKAPIESRVIELGDIEEAVKVETQKRNLIPFITIALIIFALVVYLLNPTSINQSLNLIAPGVANKKLSPEEISNAIKSGASHFLRDTFADYLKAQSDFVSVIESDPKNKEAYALLCISYLELWPYMAQNSKDLQTLSLVRQMASKADPTGQNGSTCRAVDDFLKNNVDGAKSQVDSTLNGLTSTDQPPVLIYYLKARQLGDLNELQSALGYINSAQSLWAQWMRPYVFEAELHIKNNDPNRAAVRLRQVLTAVPEHRVAQVELGVIEHRVFKNYELAMRLIKAGVSNEPDVPKGVLSRGFYTLAELYLQQNDKRSALKMAQKSYSSNPSNRTAKNLVVKLGGEEKLGETSVKGQQLVYEGDQFVREGNCSSAQAHYKAAFQVNNRNAVAAMKAARCLWSLSFSTEAIEWLNKAIRADPALTDAYVLLADYYTQRFDYFAATQTLARGQSIARRSYQILRGFALVELRRNNPKGAVSFGKKALQLYETDVETQVIIAKAHMALGEYRDAFSASSKAIEIDPNDREAQIVYVKALKGVQGLQVASNQVESLIRAFPLIMDYRLAYADILIEEQRYGTAEAILKQVLEIDQKNQKGWMLLAKSLSSQGQINSALDALFKAAVFDPADAEPLFQAGKLYIDAKKPVDAIKQFERVLRINGKYPLVNYYIGRCELMRGNTDEALRRAETERKSNPNLADPYLLSAEAHTVKQQYRLCAREYQNAIRLRPQGASIYVKVAHCYRLAGSLDVAMTMLTQALTLESGNPDIYREQGAIFEMRGDRVPAIEAYNQYLVLSPNAIDRSQIQEKIQNLQR